MSQTQQERDTVSRRSLDAINSSELIVNKLELIVVLSGLDIEMAVFDNIRYWLSDSIPQERKDALTSYLTNNGAEGADGVGDATHIVTNTPQFEGWKRVEENEIDVHVTTVSKSTLLLSRFIAEYCYRKSGLRGLWYSGKLNREFRHQIHPLIPTNVVRI